MRTDSPWERYALIAEIIRRFDDSHRRLGKTVLQKLIFLLQRVYLVECGYSYTLYTHGPYCADVARDLDVVESFGGAVVKDSSLGYSILPGQLNADLREGATDYLDQIAAALDNVVENFGSFNAKELELRSTIIYLDRLDLTLEELTTLVHQVKPHFTPAQITAVIGELGGRGLLSQALPPVKVS